MERCFIMILNNALTVSVLIFAIIVLRLLFQKAPKGLICFLWVIVAVKLIVPVPLESTFSLLPNRTPVSVGIVSQQEPMLETGLKPVDAVVNPVIHEQFTSARATGVNVIQVFLHVGTIVWIIGVLGMLAYTVVTYILLKRRVRVSIRTEQNTYECDDISGPFIFGIVRPKIYYPSGMVREEKEFVLRHEKAHLKRKDHLWKPLGFVILSIYWFQPLCWIAYILFCRDIEYACDERATLGEDKQWKADYCQALLNCSVGRKRIAACPVAFGEDHVKGRVKNIMNYKKPAVWIVLLAMAAFAVVSVCFATTKKNDDNVEYHFTCDYGSSKLYSKEDMDEAIQTIMNEFHNWKGCEMHSIRYGSDQTCSEGDNLSWMQELENANDNKETFTECIMFECDFHSPKSDADAGGLNVDEEYTDWQWWLARSEDGPWKLMTWGY